MFEEVLLKACSQPEWVGTTTATTARGHESDAIARYNMIIHYK